MPFSTIFQLYRGGKFDWWRKTSVLCENHRPVTSHWQTLTCHKSLTNFDLSQVTDKLWPVTSHWQTLSHDLIVIIITIIRLLYIYLFNFFKCTLTSNNTMLDVMFKHFQCTLTSNNTTFDVMFKHHVKHGIVRC